MCQCEGPSASPTPGNLGYPTDFHEQYVAGWRLGRGTAGQVFTAIRRSDGRKLAVKVIAKIPEDPDVAASEKARAEHLRLVALEVQVLKELRGAPNVIQFEDVFEDADKIYLVTELCTGGCLATKRSSFREKEVARFMVGVLTGVARSHAAGIVHRDVKPDNFLFTTKDRKAELKIIDFGIAARCDPMMTGPFPIEDLGYPCGTLPYMAPEVTRAQWWPTSDVWAVGIMAAQMLTGAFPFTDPETPEDPDAGRTFKAIRKQELDTSGREWTKMSSAAVDFVRHLLVKEPRHRPTAEQALRHPFLAVADGASAASSLATSANASLEPGEELPWLGPGNSGPVEAATLAQRLQRFALSTAQSSASLSSMAMSSPNASFDPMRDELPLAPETPAEGGDAPAGRGGIFSRLRRMTRRSSVKAH